MLTNEYHLSRLHVGEPGLQDIDVLLPEVGRRQYDVTQLGEDIRTRLAQPQPHIGRHLIIPTAARVKLPSQLSDQLCQSTFVGRVDVLIRRSELEDSTAPFLANFL